MIIRDTLLDETGLNEIETKIKEIPWYLRDHKVREGDGFECLSHTVYFADKPVSDVFNLLHRYFVCPLDLISWWRIRLNITWKQNDLQVFGWHTDHEACIDNPKYNNMTTALFYLSNTNGPTVFKSEDKVDCVKNRLVMFNSTLEHSGSSHTEGDDKRIVINFNYF